MSRSFPVTFICRCRKKWYGGQICTVGKTGRKGFTAVNMRYPALFTARNAVKFTEELRGTTEESAPQCGGAAPAWNTDRKDVMRRRSMSQSYRRWWQGQSMTC